MIQDIEPYVLDNMYRPGAEPEANDRVFVFEKNTVLIRRTETELDFPLAQEFESCEGFFYLFAVGDERFFLAPKDVSYPAGYEFEDVKALRGSGLDPKYRRFALVTAKHLNDWYTVNVFCGRCGAKTFHSEKERAKICPDCGNVIYPKICPAVIVGVTNGDKLLLTKYKRGYGHNALVAGFTEIGETLEQTVAREVMEEAGIRVKNIRYYKSQPWGIADDILTGFYCDVDGDDMIVMDEGELKYADWVERSEIELQPDDSSLTNEMMKMFKEGKQ
ncbi:MAG: NAD(+) diphosphatase [Lachnospiraceae bacterium]|nr:NAD(+) diphosphatase [Lachnospiraceae bacterium]